MRDRRGARGRNVGGAIALLLLAVASTAIGAGPAGASCAYTADDASTVVFVGVATDVRIDERPIDQSAASTFVVEGWRDGRIDTEAVVRTNAAGADPDGPGRGIADARPVVARGDRWEVHARPGADGTLDAACSQSVRLATGIPTPTSNATRWALPLTAAAVALIALGTVLVRAARRRLETIAAASTR